ncbi:MAG TPA: hypothetical protein PKW08_04405 [Flavobacteriaceae bacterium]|nr:hypothetical protein [Flavobacteriaceae bacterium]MCB9212701.1 hypothetical protein [Alteromonas sp.]HPF11784.1 hypothetical protein [Flavobacteriaceae bacterium]HQU20810.1 hypothetical protein [Flavobacteriaceae bacterium]HQU64985.1 hypothetical protein [Flavobacteriaceae bacterium]
MLLKRNTLTHLFFLTFLTIIVSCNKDEGTPKTDDTVIVDDTTDDDPQGNTFTGELTWLKTYGGSDIDQAVGVVEANDGNYVVLGATFSTDGELSGIKTGGDSDYWVLKISKTGNIIWSKVYGDTSDELATNIHKTSDGGYVLSGYSQSNNCDLGSNGGFYDYWLLKIDENGNEVWCQNYGYAGNDQAFDVFETHDGGYFAAGYFDVTASGGEGNNDRAPQSTLHGVGEYWGIKMDAQGDYFWTRYFGGVHFDKCYRAIETAEGDFLMVGTSESVPGENSDIENSHGTYDWWVVKVSSAGDKLWTKTFGGSEIDIAYDIQPTSDGNFFVVGDTRSNDQDVTQNKGNADVWLIKMSPTGNILWQKTYGGDQFDSAKKILPISDNNYLIIGSCRSANGDATANKGQNDAWAIVVDDQGTLLFEKNIGGANLDFAESAIYTADGSIIVVGNSESNDGDITENKGSKDFLIFKIN